MKKIRAARPPRTETIDETAPAALIINGKFGGLARFVDAAEKAGYTFATSTVWGWLKRGVIPLRQITTVKAIAQAQRPKVQVKDGDFVR